MRACLFDIDGTLVATGGAGKAAMDAALAEVFGITEAIKPVSMSGRTDRGIASDQFRLHDIEDSAENWQRLVDAYVRNLPDSLHRHNGTVLPGIVEVLKQISSTEVAVGLLTGNVPDGARIKLTHYRLYHHFAFGSFGDRHHTRDEIAHEALRLVRQQVDDGVEGADIVVVGDTPLDVQCARAIGARVVAVATGVHSYDELAETRPDVLLNDLSDATELLRFLG